MREVGEINSNQKKKKSIKLNYVTFTDWLVTRLILNGSQPLTRDKFSFMLSAASYTEIKPVGFIVLWGSVEFFVE